MGGFRIEILLQNTHCLLTLNFQWAEDSRAVARVVCLGGGGGGSA